MELNGIANLMLLIEKAKMDNQSFGVSMSTILEIEHQTKLLHKYMEEVFNKAINNQLKLQSLGYNPSTVKPWHEIREEFETKQGGQQ